MVAAAMVLFAASSYRLFLEPSVDAPTPADAVVMLGGRGPRGDEALKLLNEGYADTVAFSAPYDEDTGVWDMKPCNPGLQPVDGQVVCFEADPATTQGEVRAIVDLAAERGWTHIIVVASKDQVTRGRILFDRCWEGDADFVGVSPPDPLFRLAYEWGATVKALTIKRGC